jgi:hypothetical protein
MNAEFASKLAPTEKTEFFEVLKIKSRYELRVSAVKTRACGRRPALPDPPPRVAVSPPAASPEDCGKSLSLSL